LPTPRCIAITGSSSFLGRHVGDRLRARDPKLKLVAIDRRRPYGLDAGLAFHAVDLTEPTADAALAEVFEKEGVTAVLHAAFRTEPHPDLDYDHELETIGTLHLLHACEAARIRRLVMASTTMAYGPWPDNPNFLSEDHPLRGHPEAHNVMNRVEAEDLVAEFRARHREVQVSVLRCGWIVGPSYRDAVVRYLDRPVVPTLMGYDPLLQLVHEEDCLRAFEIALLDGRPGVYNVVAPDPLPLTSLLRGAGKRPLPIPARLLYRLRYYPSAAQTGDHPAAFYDYLRYLWVADGTRGWAAFGEPLYSTREAWMSFVASRRMQRYR